MTEDRFIANYTINKCIVCLQFILTSLGGNLYLHKNPIIHIIIVVMMSDG